jgi:hypothetical protein
MSSLVEHVPWEHRDEGWSKPEEIIARSAETLEHAEPLI